MAWRAVTEIVSPRREPLLETDVELDRIAPLPESKWRLDRHRSLG